uniref:CD99 antigen-like protein 2 n=1 Tax=Periophthalmus magnuspinnatus TaxID=409849 RepID=A0A3B3ZFU8_9GOBI
DGFDLSDAFDPGKYYLHTLHILQVTDVFSGEFSDSDLYNVGNDDSYKPDKGKGTHYNELSKTVEGGGGATSTSMTTTPCVTETTAEVGTIAGIVSAVAMALVGAISSYVSYQKKKFCFSIQRKDLSFRNVSVFLITVPKFLFFL